jgi:N-methylhydantoinase A
MTRLAISVDVGGTFTDTVVIDEGGKVIDAKAASTPQDLSVGIFDSIANAAQKLDLTLEQLVRQAIVISHGSTVATNTVLTRKGPKVGHITTLGMEDNLIIGRLRLKSAGLTRQDKMELAKLDKPEPIVPRPLIRGIVERIDYAGRIVVPLDLESVRQAIRDLEQEGVEAISVCLMWSCRNQQHEQQVKEIANSMYPQIHVDISSEVCPLVGEYERAATTVINSYIARNCATYLVSVERKLRALGFGGAFLLMQSGGGLMPLEMALKRPVTMLNSGPVGGVIGASNLGKRYNHNKIITADVGGTSFDVALVGDGRAEYASEPIVGRYHVSIPMLDVRSIGAGGGSIAWVDPMTGILRVGPQSAGAVPGPACYDRGGVHPTLTDADLILNRINPDYFLGGAIKLNRDKSLQAMEQFVAKPLSLDVKEAAAGVVKIADSHMASLVHNITVGEGHDPRDFMIYAYGGMSGAHVTSFANALGIHRVLIPRNAAVFSAFGIGTSDYVHIKERSALLLMPWNVEEFNSIFDELEREVLDELHRDGVSDEDIVIERSVDLRYIMQAHVQRMRLPSGTIDSAVLDQLPADFEREYERKYGQGAALAGWPLEGLGCRVIGTGKAIPVSLAEHKEGVERPSPRASKGVRNVYFEEGEGFVRTRIYERDRLGPGNVVAGPAILEAPDTTIVVHPGQTARVDKYLNLVIQL